MYDDVPLEDRRIFDRRNYSSLLRFSVGAKDVKGEGVVKNISASGAAFITKNRLRPKDPVEIWIDVPDGRNPIHKTGQVVWAKENLVDACEAGVKFDSVGLMSLSRIFKTLGRT